MRKNSRKGKGTYSNPNKKKYNRKKNEQSSDKRYKKLDTVTKYTKQPVGKKTKKATKKAASLFLSTDNFKMLCFELPVDFKRFHKLTKQSEMLIANFLEKNSWVMKLVEQTIKNHNPSKLTYSCRIVKFIDTITKFNLFVRNKYFRKRVPCSYADCRDVFFYKGKNKQWYFCINVSDAYDTFVIDRSCKERDINIPYAITIKHLIYKNVKMVYEKRSCLVNNYLALYKVDTDVKKYLLPQENVRYMFYINDKTKRKYYEENPSDYKCNTFNNVVVKEIPVYKNNK